MSLAIEVFDENHTSSRRRFYLYLVSMVIWAYMFSVNVYKIWYVVCALAVATTSFLLALRSIRVTITKTSLLLVFMYFLYILLSSFWSISSEWTLEYVAVDIIYFFVFLLFYILVLNLPLTRISSNLAFWVYPGIVSSIYFFYFGKDLGRIGTLVYSLLPAILPYIWLNAFYVKGFRRYRLFALALAALLLLVVSMSRAPLASGLMVSFVSLIAFGGLSFISVSRILFGGIVFVLMGASLWLFNATREAMIRSYVRIVGEDAEVGGIYVASEGLDKGRAMLSEAMNEVIFRFQPFGMGYRNFSVWSEENLGIAKSIHNTYHAWLVEGGMMLAAIVAFMFVFFFFSLRKLIKRSNDEYERNFAKATVFSMMGICFIGYFHQIHQAPVFFIVLGIGYGLIDRNYKRFYLMRPVGVPL